MTPGVPLPACPGTTPDHVGSEAARISCVALPTPVPLTLLVHTGKDTGSFFLCLPFLNHPPARSPWQGVPQVPLPLCRCLLWGEMKARGRDGRASLQGRRRERRRQGTWDLWEAVWDPEQQLRRRVLAYVGSLGAAGGGWGASVSFEATLPVFWVFLGFACLLGFGVIKAMSLDKKVQREENEPLTVAGGGSGAPPRVRWVEPLPGTPHTCAPRETGQAWGPPHTWPRHPPFAHVSFVSCSLTTAETAEQTLLQKQFQIFKNHQFPQSYPISENRTGQTV